MGSNRRIARRGWVVFAAVLAVGGAAQGAWDTTRFEVELHRSRPFSDAAIQEIETYLHETAELFEQMGFRPSTLQTTEGGEAYRVHLVDRGEPIATEIWSRAQLLNGNPKAAASGCSSLRSEIWVPITGQYFDTSNQVRGKLYQDLAHELFHTVQYNYRAFHDNDCTLGAWILEGTAEAIGVHIARVLRNVRPYTACQMGVRSYDSTLHIELRDGTPCTEADGDRNPYNTKSFWRFLGEYEVLGARPTARRSAEPVYDYLARLFEAPLAQTSARNEYRWLDRVLHDELGFGLSYAFSSFSASFAEYWKPSRRAKYPPPVSPPSDPEKRWIELIFGQCEPARISLDGKAKVSLELPAVSSRCIEATFDASGPANFDVFAYGTGHELMSLSLATAGGRQRVRPEPWPEASSGSPPERVRFGMSINVPARRRVYLIVSNVAERAERTNEQTPYFELVPQASVSSADPVPEDTNDAATPAAGETGDLAEQEVAASINQLIWYTSADPDRPIECTPERPGNLCGPTTSIRLSKTAATTGLLGQAVQPGVSLDRKMEVIGFFQERGMAAVDELMQAQQAILSVDGAEILIRIPRIEYGFTGSIDNASISVSRGVTDDNDGGYHQALGPSRIGGCPGGYYPHSGRVTIEEATPFALRGRYSAQLVDPSRAGDCSISSLPVVKTISGRFSIPEPGLGDRTVGRFLGGDREDAGLTEEQLVDQIWQQMSEMMPGMMTGELGDQLRERVDRRLKARAERRAQGDRGGTRDCECNCFTKDSVSPECRRDCEPFYRECEVNPELREYSEAMRPPTDDEQRQIADLRRRFVELLEALGHPDEYRETMLEAFDSVPGLAMKKKLYDSLASQRGS